MLYYENYSSATKGDLEQENIINSKISRRMTEQAHAPTSRRPLTKHRNNMDGWRLHHFRNTKVKVSGREMVALTHASNLQQRKNKRFIPQQRESYQLPSLRYKTCGQDTFTKHVHRATTLLRDFRDKCKLFGGTEPDDTDDKSPRVRFLFVEPSAI